MSNKLSLSVFARSRPVAAKQPDDEAKRSPSFVILARRSPASIFGAAQSLITYGGKIRRFKSRETAEADARRMKADLDNDFVTFEVVELDEMKGEKSQ
jgi:hypothetical protein